MMWEACARKFAALGGRILMGRQVVATQWDHAARRWRVTARRADGAVETYFAENLVSSAPLREMARMLSPRPRSLTAAEALAYRDFLTVVLIGRSKTVLPDNWLYIHDPQVKVGRVQNFRSWSPEMLPDQESVCLGLEYFCFEGDELWAASDQELIGLAKREIDRLGLMAGGDVLDATVVRQTRAYPVYDDGYRENVAAVRAELAALYPTLHMVGRNGMHKYNNQDHAMMTGLLTALNITAGELRFDPWGVNEDAEYAEAGVEGAREALASERLVPRRAAA
jgi:protoporphyrinogen oxidase